MPWRTTSAMDERCQFVLDAKRDLGCLAPKERDSKGRGVCHMWGRYLASPEGAKQQSPGWSEAKPWDS